MVGAVLVEPTVMLNSGNALELLPSLTVIRIFAKRPTLLALGVPQSRPVARSKLSQPGRFSLRNVSVRPSGSDADGRKEYSWPGCTLVGGVPEILGGRLTVCAAAAWDRKNRIPTGRIAANRAHRLINGYVILGGPRKV